MVLPNRLLPVHALGIFSGKHAFNIPTDTITPPLNHKLCSAGRECEVDEDLVRLVPCMKGAGPTAASLLIECRGQTPEILQVRGWSLQQGVSVMPCQSVITPCASSAVSQYLHCSD